MSAKDVLNLALLGGIAYVAYKLMPGVSTATNATSNAIANFYTWATLPPAMVLQGNIALPSGQLVPLSEVDIRQNPNGTVAAAFAGSVYQLSPSDANGNYPAVLIG